MPFQQVLSLGFDRILMRSRSLLLRGAGFHVIEVYSCAGALQLARSDSVDILLICHSVPKTEQRKLTEAVRGERRLMPILCIVPTTFVIPPDGCLPIDNEPALLVDAIEQASLSYVTKSSTPQQPT
jgi:DNA-binding NarL/FixJ family response regulator